MDAYPKEIIDFITDRIAVIGKIRYIPKHIRISFPLQYIEILNHTAFLNATTPRFIERLYCMMHNINEIPICKHCGKIVAFRKYDYGYHQFCSRECSNANDQTKQNKIASSMRKFGTPHPMNTIEIRTKLKNKFISLFGVDNPAKLKENIIKANNTRILKYGQIQNVAKIQETNLRKYGYACSFQRPDVQEKIKQNNMIKYGVTNHMKLDRFKEIYIQRKLENGTLYWPSIGKHEKEILDEIEKEKHIKLIRQYHVSYYFIDGYCKETNTAYEIYEDYHYLSKPQMEKDLKRQKRIQEKLGCAFVIIPDLKNSKVHQIFKEVEGPPVPSA